MKDFWICRACGHVWTDEQTGNDPMSLGYRKTCGNIFCDGTVDLLAYPIITEQRTDDWIAYMKDKPETWDAGITENDAVEKLLASYRARKYS
jgi:hypothetical protein